MLSGARLYARPLELKLDRRFVAHMEEHEITAVPFPGVDQRADGSSFTGLVSRRIHFVRRLTMFSRTISPLKVKTCWSAGSTVMRTQWVSGSPNVSTRVKFSKRRLVFVL